MTHNHKKRGEKDMKTNANKSQNLLNRLLKEGIRPHADSIAPIIADGGILFIADRAGCRADVGTHVRHVRARRTTCGLLILGK